MPVPMIQTVAVGGSRQEMPSLDSSHCPSTFIKSVHRKIFKLAHHCLGIINIMQHDTEREALHELLSIHLESGHRVAPTATTMDIEEALADEAYYTGGLVHCAMQPMEEDTPFLERAPSPTDPYFTSATTDVELALLRNDEDFFVAREEEPMD
ncbi:hypothetical protein C8F04DRAFT_1202508, partial [Mycena alexandri]